MKKGKKKFYCCDDYGMGGIWFIIFARSPKEITEKYPFLYVTDEEPSWLRPNYPPVEVTKRLRAALKKHFTLDIDDPPNKSLRGLQKEHQKDLAKKARGKG